MFLKRLDITGFKSFPDKIRLDFHSGLTAVVGPNGSGKSNIADAIRWVMGEQSAKSLRGAKMEDVIFAGTEHRRPLGYAEVNMLIDNGEHKLPLDFNEVTLSRRVYRSGESEYAMNGVTCRLKDIQQLFMDTGVGREGYSIIGQGRIDEILSVRSEDRRLLFEEAVGIIKYKTRRNEALSKLERERQNITRINDIIEEISVQLEPLAEQAERAKTYLSLKEQYKIVHLNLFLEESQRKDAERLRMEKMLSDLSSQSVDWQRLLTEARTACESLKASAASAEIDYRLANKRLIDMITEIEKNDSDIKLLESEREHEQQNRERLLNEINRRCAEIARKQAEQQDETEALETAENELAALEIILSEHQEHFKVLDEAMRAREQALDGYNKANLEQASLLAEMKSRIREAENDYARLEENKERINSEILHNDTLLSSAEEERVSIMDAVRGREREAARLEKSLSAYQDAYTQLSSRLSQMDVEHRETQAALQECASRHKILRELESSHEGYYRSVRSVLKKKEEDARFAGICGAVGELIGVSREYETAIEIALGGSAQHIVTRTEADAQRAIDMLKNNREGRATFLPLTAIKGRVTDVSKIRSEPGYIGIASELTVCEPLYEPVMSNLLGGVVVMDSLPNAVALFKKYRYTHKIVTLEGDLLNPGGAMTGGSVNKQSAGIVGRGRKLTELTERLTALQSAELAQSEAFRMQTDKVQTTQLRVTQTLSEMQALALERNNLENRLAKLDERLAGLLAGADAYEQENKQLMALLVETNAAIREAKRKLAEQEAQAQRVRQEMDDYQSQISDERIMKDEHVAALTEIKLEIGRKQSSLSVAGANKDRLLREQGVLETEREVLLSELTASDQLTAQKEAAISHSLEQGRVLQTRLSEQRDELSGIERHKTELETAIQRAEADEREHRDAAARLDQEITRLTIQKEQVDAEYKRLYDEIWDEYGLTLQTAQDYYRSEYNGAHLRREEKRLKSELALLTDVNVGAIEANKQLKTRYDFLTAQRDDIVKAEDDLKSVVKELTKQMEARFAEQFSLISEHFNTVFREMFNGGKAGLSLMDENNILESGIEIIAQPPGKSLQTLTLLSGGERALTAIALLFGILRMKPSPFCVLDEIEAALDDANVARFARFLKQYAGETQFIVITHRKGTMEAADVLYGVTMQEQGISKMVSVRFSEVQE